MALTVESFMAIRGEFSAVYEADPTRVSNAVAAAIRQTDATIFADDTDEAAMWLAAHLLAADPLGKDARIVGKKALPTTLYMSERMRLEELYACAYALALPGVDPECP